MSALLRCKARHRLECAGGKAHGVTWRASQCVRPDALDIRIDGQHVGDSGGAWCREVVSACSRGPEPQQQVERHYGGASAPNEVRHGEPRLWALTHTLAALQQTVRSQHAQTSRRQQVISRAVTAYCQGCKAGRPALPGGHGTLWVVGCLSREHLSDHTMRHAAVAAVCNRLEHIAAKDDRLTVGTACCLP